MPYYETGTVALSPQGETGSEREIATLKPEENCFMGLFYGTV